MQRKKKRGFFYNEFQTKIYDYQIIEILDNR
jgi:hypothetical protein